jgi:hypothetical protein
MRRCIRSNIDAPTSACPKKCTSPLGSMRRVFTLPMSCSSAAHRTSVRGTACSTTCLVCFHTSLWRHSPSPKPTMAFTSGSSASSAPTSSRASSPWSGCRPMSTRSTAPRTFGSSTVRNHAGSHRTTPSGRAPVLADHAAASSAITARSVASRSPTSPGASGCLSSISLSVISMQCSAVAEG